MDLHGTLYYRGDTQRIVLELQGRIPWPATLQLRLLHPMDATRDIETRLQQVRAGQYVGNAAWTGSGKRYVQIEPDVVPENPWRLRGTLVLDQTGHASLGVSPD